MLQSWEERGRGSPCRDKECECCDWSPPASLLRRGASSRRLEVSELQATGLIKCRSGLHEALPERAAALLRCARLAFWFPWHAAGFGGFPNLFS